MKITVTTSLVLVLSVGSWAYFYWQGMPLGPKETAVVCAGWMLLVLAAKWVWTRIRRTSKGETA